MPWNTFVDPNARDQIQLQAFLGSGEPLPTWLQFDWSTATFSGVPGANGTLDVQLIANDGKGGRNSTRFDIVVGDPAPPARAVVSVPGWVIGDRTPTITWTRDSNAAYWDISIRNITTGTEFLRDQNVPSPTFTLPEVSSPTEFRVWVRTLNADNVSSGWSQGVNFTVSDVAPVRPTLNGPAAVTANAWPTITWNTDVNATRYDVEITNLDSGAVIFRDKQFTATTLTPPAVLAEGNYRVGVQAFNDFGSRSGYSFKTFEVDVPTPGQPTLTGPKAVSTDATPKFSWTAVVNAARYDLWVDNMSTGETQVIRQPMLTGTMFTATTPLAAGDYRAQVKAFNSVNEGGLWSAIHNFTIVAEPAEAVEWISPSGVTLNPRPTFAWTEVPDALRYDLWVNNLTTGERQVIRQPNLTQTWFRSDEDLSAGDYRAWVKVFTADGDSLWSEANDFTIPGALITAISNPVAPAALRAEEVAGSSLVLDPTDTILATDASQETEATLQAEDVYFLALERQKPASSTSTPEIEVDDDQTDLVFAQVLKLVDHFAMR